MRLWTTASAFDRARVLLAVLILAIGAAHVVWPAEIKLDTPSLVLVGLLLVLLVLPLLEELTLPGNVSARFRREVAEVDGATLSLLQAEGASTSDGVQAGSGTSAAGLPRYLDALATVAPAAASAAIRAEVEHRLRAAYELTLGVTAPESTAEVVRQLLTHGFIDPYQAELVYRILALANTGAQASNTGAADAMRLVTAARRVSGSLSASTERRLGRFLREVATQLERARTVRKIDAFEGSPPRPDFVAETDRGVLVVEPKLIAERADVAHRIRDARRQLQQKGINESQRAVVVVPDHTNIPQRMEQGPIPVVRVSDLARWIDQHA
jgi:hypothetical protein